MNMFEKLAADLNALLERVQVPEDLGGNSQGPQASDLCFPAARSERDPEAQTIESKPVGYQALNVLVSTGSSYPGQ